MQILSNATANSSSETFRLSSKSSGKLFVAVVGTWDTATATLEINFGGSVWFAASAGTTFTADGYGSIELPGSATCRVTISSVGAGTDLDAFIISDNVILTETEITARK